MTMRFDEFVQKRGVAVSPVDRFAGLVVEVGLPADWEPFDSAPGVRVWACRSDPCIQEFCANAVLTMHCVAAPFDADEVFSMLSTQQVHSMHGGQELHRELAAATSGDGIVGSLAMRIASELGAIDSVSQTRIIATEQETLIAQLTVTALHDSTVDRVSVWLNMRAGASVSSASAADLRGVPVAGSREGH